jgi:hypothetical protein
MAFLPDALFPADSTVRYDYIQASEAPVMQSLFAKYLSDLAAENAPLEDKLGVFDLDVAGGGDGHTFVCRILVSDSTDGVQWTASQIADGEIAAQFWLASDAEALEQAQTRALALLMVEEDHKLEHVAVGLAGASQGTRFMGFMAGRVAPPPNG